MWTHSVLSQTALSRTSRARKSGSSPFSFSLLLGVLPNLDHALVVAIHAIYSLASLGENKFVDAILAYFALETVGVVGIIASHYSLVKDRSIAHVAAVRAVCAYGRAVGQKQKVCVCGHLVTAFCAFEAIDMEKGLTRIRRALVS